MFANENVNKYLFDMMKDKSQQSITYKVKSQLSKGTLGGELRELCGFITNHLNITQNISEFEFCLPNLLKSKGWATTVVHPGPRGIYNRPIIYKAIGFEKYFSAENFTEINGCGGGWAGAPCDSLIISKKLKEYIDPNKKNLLYYLSINSHHPYTNDMQNIQACEELDIKIGVECEYFSHLKLTFISIAEFITNNKGHYYITGDHSPPGLDNKIAMKDIIPIFKITHYEENKEIK